MAWEIRLSPEADKQLSRLPRDHQETITKSIDSMRENPFQGDVEPLKGKKWKGRYRKVAGRYRVIFIPFRQQQIIEISQILLRSEKTYR